MALIDLVVMLVGLALWKGGRRGYFVGSHPHCKKCEFDLFALPLQTRRCPECGADIFADDAIHVGRRQPILALIISGAVLMFGGAGGLSLGIARWWPHFDGSPYKPVAWLESEMRSGDKNLRRRACTELERRISIGALSQRQVDHLAQCVLALQGDSSIEWYPRWGDLIQEAQILDAAHRVSPALWDQFVARAVVISAQVRPQVRMGDPVPIAVSCQLRAGSDFTALDRLTFAPEVMLSMESAAGRISGAGRSPDHSTSPGGPDPLTWNLLWIPAGNTDPAGNPHIWPRDLTAGRHRLKMDITLTASTAAKVQMRSSKNFSLDILPADQTSVRLVHADAADTGGVGAQMARAVGLSGTNRSSPVAPLVFIHGGTLGYLLVSNPPRCAAFRVVLRQKSPRWGEREWGLSRVMVRPGAWETLPLNIDDRSPMDRPDDGAAEIVCIPDPAMAVGTVDVQEVWGDPVVLPVIIQMGD